VDTGTVFDLDWRQGTYRAAYSLPRLGWHREALFGWPYPGSSWKPHGKTRFLDVGKRRFLLWEESPMLVFEEVAGEWRLRAAIGCASGYYHALVRFAPPEFDCTAFPGYDPATWSPGKWPLPRNFKDLNFIWCDENGDGLAQTAEFQTAPLANPTDRRWSGQTRPSARI
jgi:hypothetical protein